MGTLSSNDVKNISHIITIIVKTVGDSIKTAKLNQISISRHNEIIAKKDDKIRGLDIENKETPIGTLGEKYLILKKIGYGSYSNVYLAMSKIDSKIRAIKVLKEVDKYNDIFKNETEMLKIFTGQKNIINMIEYESYAPFKLFDDKSKDSLLHYISLELAEKGELFEYLQLTKRGFGEENARYIFKEIMNGVKLLSKEGIVHRDIKIENILITKDNIFKIADFGFAANINATDSRLFYSGKGSGCYMAPEIIDEKPYGEKVDVFSLGVVLFMLVTSYIPFSRAEKSDDFYRHFYGYNKDVIKFWKAMKRNIADTTNEFKSLINSMLAQDPNERLDFSKVIDHAWMKLHTPSKKEFDLEFEKLELTKKTKGKNNRI